MWLQRSPSLQRIHAFVCLVATLELQQGVCLLPRFLRKHWEINGPLTERAHTSGGPVPSEGGRKENPASTCLLSFEHRRVLLLWLGVISAA